MSYRRIVLRYLAGGVAVAACVAFVIALPRIHGGPAFPLRTADRLLGLRVTKSADELLVAWKPVESANRAVLSIRDAGRSEDVELNMPAYHSGGVLYSPLGNDVTFRLEVSGPQATQGVSESVTALGFNRPPTLQPNAPPVEDAVFEQPSPVPPATKQLVLPAVLPGKAPAALAEPPAMAAQFNASSFQVSLPASPTPAAPAAAPPVPVAPQMPPRAPAALRVQQMKILRQTIPVYPPAARQARVVGTVTVEARVSEDGRVEHAEAISGPPMLRWIAARAVQEWLFEPATVNGGRVKAVARVDVVFRP